VTYSREELAAAHDHLIALSAGPASARTRSAPGSARWRSRERVEGVGRVQQRGAELARTCSGQFDVDAVAVERHAPLDAAIGILRAVDSDPSYSSSSPLGDYLLLRSVCGRVRTCRRARPVTAFLVWANPKLRNSIGKMVNGRTPT
jgi:hypothetical protein